MGRVIFHVGKNCKHNIPIMTFSIIPLKMQSDSEVWVFGVGYGEEKGSGRKSRAGWVQAGGDVGGMLVPQPLVCWVEDPGGCFT